MWLVQVLHPTDISLDPQREVSWPTNSSQATPSILDGGICWEGLSAQPPLWDDGHPAHQWWFPSGPLWLKRARLPGGGPPCPLLRDEATAPFSVFLRSLGPRLTQGPLGPCADKCPAGLPALLLLCVAHPLRCIVPCQKTWPGLWFCALLGLPGIPTMCRWLCVLFLNWLATIL